jgi:hypothetical protein
MDAHNLKVQPSLQVTSLPPIMAAMNRAFMKRARTTTEQRACNPMRNKIHIPSGKEEAVNKKKKQQEKWTPRWYKDTTYHICRWLTVEERVRFGMCNYELLEMLLGDEGWYTVYFANGNCGNLRPIDLGFDKVLTGVEVFRPPIYHAWEPESDDEPDYGEPDYVNIPFGNHPSHEWYMLLPTPGLKKLYIENNTNEDIYDLDGLTENMLPYVTDLIHAPNLKSLTVVSDMMQDEQLKGLTDLSNLTELHLIGSCMEIDQCRNLLKILKQSPNLTSFASRAHLRREHLEELVKKRLTSLYLKAIYTGIKELATMTTLKTLEIHGAHFRARDLQAILKANPMKHLRIRLGTVIEDEPVNFAGCMDHITSLTLDGFECFHHPRDLLHILMNCPNLRELVLFDSRALSTTACQYMQMYCPHLESVYIIGTGTNGDIITRATYGDTCMEYTIPFSDRGVQHLFRIPSLKRLVLKDIEFTMPEVDELSHCGHLEELSLWDTRGYKTCDIRQILQSNPQLTHFNPPDLEDKRKYGDLPTFDDHHPCMF